MIEFPEKFRRHRNLVLFRKLSRKSDKPDFFGWMAKANLVIMRRGMLLSRRNGNSENVSWIVWWSLKWLKKLSDWHSPRLKKFQAMLTHLKTSTVKHQVILLTRHSWKNYKTFQMKLKIIIFNTFFWKNYHLWPMIFFVIISNFA